MSVDLVFDNPRQLLSEVIFPELTAQTGDAIFGLFIGFAVLMMLYIASDRHWGPPAIVLTLSGAWLTSVVPAQFAGVVKSLIIIGIVAGLLAIAERFFLRPTA
jgi:hypothetical protein